MKKRCTNSACRKYFEAEYSCPYCGKLYPRFKPLSGEGEYKIRLIDYKENVPTLVGIEKLSGYSFAVARELMIRRPSIIGKHLTREEALRWYQTLNRPGTKLEITQ